MNSVNALNMKKLFVPAVICTAVLLVCVTTTASVVTVVDKNLQHETTQQQDEKTSVSHDSAKSKIEMLLQKQADRWNAKDIEGFMETYWKSNQLTFSAGGKTTRGWQSTLERYKTKYPPEKMGKLTFDHLETTLLGDKAALVLGQWHLKFSGENGTAGKTHADGNFSLVLRKMDGIWKIIHDHSSSIEEE